MSNEDIYSWLGSMSVDKCEQILKDFYTFLGYHHDAGSKSLVVDNAIRLILTLDKRNLLSVFSGTNRHLIIIDSIGVWSDGLGQFENVTDEFVSYLRVIKINKLLYE